MKIKEMTNKVNEELNHIPRIKGWLNQNMLREYYNDMRRHDLSQNPTLPAKDTLIKAIDAMRKDTPNFEPIYDKEFFNI